MDIYSRKIVGHRVHEIESMEHSASLAEEICLQEKVQKNQLVLHSDNGGAMKGATILATLKRLGVCKMMAKTGQGNDNENRPKITAKIVRHCVA